MHIIFNGPPGSGKDEACHFLKHQYGYEHLSFKEELFKETINFFGVSKEWFMKGYNDRSQKEMPCSELSVYGKALSRRGAMIYTSEKYIKPKYGAGYFGLRTVEKLNQNYSYCFSDGGFVEEVLPVINKLGTNNICVVQLFRDGCTFSSDSRNYLNGNHVDDIVIGNKSNFVESQTVHLPIRMYRVHNNKTVSNFHSAIKTIIRKESNVSKKINIPRESV